MPESYDTRYPLGYAARSPNPRLLPVGKEEAEDGDPLWTLVDALYNHAVMNQPEAFFLYGQVTPKSVTPGASTGSELYKNDVGVPVAVSVRAEMLETGTSVYLYVGDDTNIVRGTAPITLNNASPVARAVVPPAATLFGRMSAQDSDTTARNLIVVVVPLKGLQLFEGGE